MGRRIDRYVPDLLDMQEQICIDLPCLVCGYNLRAQHLHGACPKCGHKVWDSVYAHTVGNVDWLRRLNMGGTLLVWAILTALIAVGVVVLGTPLAEREVSVVALALQIVLRLLWIGLLVVAGGLALAGLLLVAARDPLQSPRPERLSVRRAMVGALTLMLLAWAAFGGLWLLDPPQGEHILAGAFWFAVGVSLELLPPLVLWHFSNVLYRAGSHGTMLAARLLAGVWPVGAALLLGAASSGWLESPLNWLPAGGLGGLLLSAVLLVILFTKAEVAQWLREVRPR